MVQPSPRELHASPQLVETHEISLLAPPRTRKEYNLALERFDVTICEACAISQAAAGQIALPHLGYGTHVFAGICGQGTAMIRALPLSRWVRSDFQFWALSGIAGYARAVIEGQLLFNYLMETPESRVAWSARLFVMHLNDCTRRITLLTNAGAEEEANSFRMQAEEIKEVLRTNNYFLTLPQNIQRRCLEGDSPMIVTRQEMLDKVGWNRGHFRAMFDLLSQHAHILPLSFYRMAPNGRGTGIENDTDRGYLTTTLNLASDALSQCTDLMVVAFPETADRRQGKKSKFSPGPRGNLPR